MLRQVDKAILEDPRVQVELSQGQRWQGEAIALRILRPASQEDRTTGGEKHRGRSLKPGPSEEDQDDRVKGLQDVLRAALRRPQRE